MPIKYYLQPNPITPDPNDQSARVVANAVLDMDGVIKAMLRQRPGLSEADLRAAVSLFFEVVSDEIANGNHVNLPLVNIKPSISGVFTSITDSFDSSRHVKRATVSNGLLLQQKMQQATVEKIKQALPSPVLLEFSDVNTGTINSKLTPGGIGMVIGEELKFNPEGADEGIFLVKEGGNATKVTVLATRTEGKLMFSIPANLKAGSYLLEVRRAYTNANAIRTGSLLDTLTVA